ncbi:hypothetical protein LJK87_09115 [Paenibacillus sp. P25]|nr:hypothetical protein LJK87_09115 [Paenibacillus sp. P25]
MFDKMEQVKLGVTLFHETLKTLRVPHEIIGFWEEADRVTPESVPNVFQVIADFASCFQERTGPKILRLEPEQDNRDGYAIRVMTERLQRRTERQKVLMIFTDGEPSASEYHEEGIVDTSEAVLQARRRGVDVISLFLGRGDSVRDTEIVAMRNLYGRGCVLVPDVGGLGAGLAPVLKRSLLRRLQT